MAEIEIDLPDDDADDVLPLGRYRARIHEADLRTASSGSEYLNIGFEIAEGPHRGRKVWENFSLVPKALWRLKRLLKAIGHQHRGPISVKTEDLESRDLVIQVAHETYQGEKRAAVKDTRPVPSSTARAASTAAGEADDEIPF